MDILVSEYINQTFTEEFKDDILVSFDLFEKFHYQGYEESLIDILSNESYVTGSDLKDHFVIEINNKLNFVIEQHEIKLTNEATISDKIQILSALYLFQDLEDYTGIIRLLESLESDYEILSLILSDLCMLDDNRIMTILDSFNPRLLTNMKTYINNKEAVQEQQIDRNRNTILNNLKSFFRFTNEDTVANQFIRDGILVGRRFYDYLSYCEDSIVFSVDELTAKNFLAVIYMSSDGINNPLLVYRKYGYRILQDLNRVTSIETHILKLLNNFNEFKKAEDEKNRLSKAGA